MNADNVVPYGKFAHEVDEKGGVEAYKAYQQTLLNTVKDNSFKNGFSAGKQELLPWLIVTGIAAVGGVAYGGYTYIKNKKDLKKEAKAKLEKDAKEAEKILVETPLHKDIIKKMEEYCKNDNDSFRNK